MRVSVVWVLGVGDSGEGRGRWARAGQGQRDEGTVAREEVEQESDDEDCEKSSVLVCPLSTLVPMGGRHSRSRGDETLDPRLYSKSPSRGNSCSLESCA